MKNVSGIGTRVARGAAVLAMLAGGLGITAAEAAPQAEAGAEAGEEEVVTADAEMAAPVRFSSLFRSA